MPERKYTSPLRMAAWLLATAFVLLLAIFAWWTRQDFVAAEQRARVEVEDAASLLEVRIQRSLTAIDAVLLGAADLTREAGLDGLKSAATTRQLKTLARFLPESGALFILDRQGDTLFASRPLPTPGVNVADRAYFKHLLAGGSEPYIGEALKGRSVHRHFFPVARAIRDSGGALLGVAQVGVEADYLADDFRALGVGAGKTFGLYRAADGRLVARQPMAEQLLGERIAGQPYIAAPGAQRSQWTGPPDARQLVAAQTVRGLPLLVTTAMTRDAVYQPAYQALLLRSAAFAAATGMLGLLGFLWLRGLQREFHSRAVERSAQKALHQNQLRLHLALEAAYLISFEWDIQRNEVRRFQSSDPALGPTPEQAPSTFEAVREVVHPDDRDLFTANVQAALARPDGRYENEFRIVHPDGQIAWLLERGVVEFAADGQPARLLGLSQDITQRKRTVEALRESEQRYRELVQTANSAVIRWRSDGTITFINAYAQTFFGWPGDEALGRHVGILVPGQESTGADLSGLIEDIVRHPQRYVNNVNENLCRDGHRVWMSWTNRAIRDESGEVTEILAIGNDITELRRAEDALRESEERLRLLSDNLPDSAVYQYAHEADGSVRFHYVSSGMERLNGVSVADVLRDATTLHRQIPTAYVERLIAAEELSARELSDFDMELPMQRPDGQVRWMRLRSRPRRLADGSTLWDGVQSDVTERRQVEEALRESEAKFRSAIANAAIGFAMTTPEGRFIDANPAYCRISGYSLDELRGRDFPIMVHADDQAVNLHLVKRMLAGEIPDFVIENRYVRKNGDSIWVRKSVSLVRDDAGVPRWILALVEDIGERKRAEAEIQSLNASLERRVAERTAELTAANQELDSFAYAVSHDLRAPLRAMGGFARVLQEDYRDHLDEPGRGYLDHIEQASRRMSDLLDGILTLSRSTRGELRRDPVDLSAQAHRILDDLALAEPGRAVTVEIEPGLMARGDPRMLEAALSNLLGNAWKYTAQVAGASIRFHAEEYDGSLWYVVEDNGAGFDMAYANRLFQPFQRLHRQDEFPGLGIGLATVQRIIHRHGGRIVASGEPGRGATFRFTLAPEPEANA